MARWALDRWEPAGRRTRGLGLLPWLLTLPFLLLGSVAASKPIPPAVKVQAVAVPAGAELQRIREQGGGADLRQRYLLAAHDFLYRYWQQEAQKQGKTLEKPQLLFAGDRAEGCGVNRIEHPMAFYCPESLQIAMALHGPADGRQLLVRTDPASLSAALASCVARDATRRMSWVRMSRSSLAEYLFGVAVLFCFCFVLRKRAKEKKKEIQKSQG